jgi:hypothetical protein
MPGLCGKQPREDTDKCIDMNKRDSIRGLFFVVAGLWREMSNENKIIEKLSYK